MNSAPYTDDSNRIVVMNSKGGCGKTTLATNLASYFALRGPPPTLIDTDPIGFSTRWLQQRPASCPRINGMRIEQLELRKRRLFGFRAPKEAGAVIIDTPAALNEHDIVDISRDADCILVPVLPSAFDVHVSTRFVAELLVATDFDRPVAVVANRTRENTRSLKMLLRTLEGLETPTVAIWRDSQNFVHAASNGIGICEMPHHRIWRDLRQLVPVVEWLDRTLTQSFVDPVTTRQGSRLAQ
ncbi:MAG: ParA family protein [Woeseiaceae bacterium]|nr:ParA family protein [Woeseiaceae bacterium]